MSAYVKAGVTQLDLVRLIFHLKMIVTGYLIPPTPHTHTLCVGGMIEICDSPTGCSRPLYVSLSRRAPLITLGCLPVPGQCEQKRRSLHGPLIYDCQANGEQLPFPAPLRSPHRDFDKCATVAKMLPRRSD